MDDFAQRLLGKIKGIEFVHKEEVKRGEIGWEVRSKMGNAQLLSPIDGTVKKMNKELSKDSSLLNADPYGKGWVLELKSFNIEVDLEGLLKGNKAKDWLMEEVNRLSHRIESDIGVSVGCYVTLIRTLRKIDEKEWKDLIRDFFLI